MDRFRSRPMPNIAAVLVIASFGSRPCCEMNAVLQDSLNAFCIVPAPYAARPSEFLSVLPNTLIVFVHGSGVVVVSPLPSNAADVTILNVEPGAYRPWNARL